MDTFILAAGDAHRFNGTLKQLLEVRGETLLARQIRQVRARGGSPAVVGHAPQIRDHAWMSDCPFIEPVARRWTAETFYSTREFWSGQTRILLGDCIYSKQTMDRIFTHELMVSWFGDMAESYAFTFSNTYEPQVLEALERVIEGASRGENPGKIRSFYGTLCGVPEEMWYYHFPATRHVIDYTRDFDSRQDWIDFQREVIGQNGIDDEAVFA